MSVWTDENWEKRHAILYKCQVSALYHRKRERFLSLLDKIGTALALIAGASAMSEILPTPELKAFAGAVVAAVTLPSVVFSWADKSRAHALLAARFIALEAEIVGAGVLNGDQLSKFEEFAIRAEIEEPPQLSALTRICQNEIALASGHQSMATPLTKFERIFAHVLDMPAIKTA